MRYENTFWYLYFHQGTPTIYVMKMNNSKSIKLINTDKYKITFRISEKNRNPINAVKPILLEFSFGCCLYRFYASI